MVALPPALSEVMSTGIARSRAWARTAGVAAILAGLVMVVHEWWDDRVPGVQEGVVPSALHATWVGQSDAAPPARRERGRWGTDGWGRPVRR
jgi:hypothetical protein